MDTTPVAVERHSPAVVCDFPIFYSMDRCSASDAAAASTNSGNRSHILGTVARLGVYSVNPAVLIVASASGGFTLHPSTACGGSRFLRIVLVRGTSVFPSPASTITPCATRRDEMQERPTGNRRHYCTGHTPGEAVLRLQRWQAMPYNTSQRNYPFPLRSLVAALRHNFTLRKRLEKHSVQPTCLGWNGLPRCIAMPPYTRNPSVGLRGAVMRLRFCGPSQWKSVRA
ncbi:hypothetical protein C8Q77DRAFT_433872 [Trametes polyzona]|nr:hypothetical protein C8Q77DRAFT_433872 [Trametes polyzona]